MLLLHVTKQNKCAYCNATVIKCIEPTCQEFFHPTNSRQRFHSPKCKMRNARRKRKEIGSK